MTTPGSIYQTGTRVDGLTGIKTRTYTKYGNTKWRRCRWKEELSSTRRRNTAQTLAQMCYNLEALASWFEINTSYLRHPGVISSVMLTVFSNKSYRESLAQRSAIGSVEIQERVEFRPRADSEGKLPRSTKMAEDSKERPLTPTHHFRPQMLKRYQHTHFEKRSSGKIQKGETRKESTDGGENKPRTYVCIVYAPRRLFCLPLPPSPTSFPGVLFLCSTTCRDKQRQR